MVTSIFALLLFKFNFAFEQCTELNKILVVKRESVWKAKLIAFKAVESIEEYFYSFYNFQHFVHCEYTWIKHHNHQAQISITKYCKNDTVCKEMCPSNCLDLYKPTKTQNITYRISNYAHSNYLLMSYNTSTMKGMLLFADEYNTWLDNQDRFIQANIF